MAREHYTHKGEVEVCVPRYLRLAGAVRRYQETKAYHRFYLTWKTQNLGVKLGALYK
jgi:hypothetical protein